MFTESDTTTQHNNTTQHIYTTFTTPNNNKKKNIKNLIKTLSLNYSKLGLRASGYSDYSQHIGFKGILLTE